MKQASITTWLLGEACTELTGWGVLMSSQRPLLAMREHSRQLTEVRGPDGRKVGVAALDVTVRYLTDTWLAPSGAGEGLLLDENPAQWLRTLEDPGMHGCDQCIAFMGDKDAELRQMARFMAEKVRMSGGTQEMGPLNPYERRIVHLAIADEAGVASESVGDAFLKTVIISRRS